MRAAKSLWLSGSVLLLPDISPKRFIKKILLLRNGSRSRNNSNNIIEYKNSKATEGKRILLSLPSLLAVATF